MSEVLDEVVKVSLVPVRFIPDAWEHISGFISEAVRHSEGRYELDDVYTLVMEHNYLLWVALGEEEMKGAVITGFCNYPRKKTLSLMFLGGKDMRTWEYQMIGTLQKFAKEQDCACLELSGREGWSRVMKREGFPQLWRTFEIPLEPIVAKRVDDAG